MSYSAIIREVQIFKTNSELSVQVYEKLWPGSLVKFEFKSKEYYYAVESVYTRKNTAGDDEVYAKLKESGYYNRISSLKRFDITELLGRALFAVEDSAEIQKIERENTFC